MREQPNPQNLIDDATQLIQAARKGNLQDITAIRDRHTDLDFVSLLAKPESSGYTALIWASNIGHKDVVQLLLQALRDAGSDIQAVVLNHRDPIGCTALMRASLSGNTAIVQLLLQALQVANADIPAAINHTTHYNDTALIRASAQGHIEIVKLLLQALHDAGADMQAALNHQGSQGYTALMLATSYGHTEILQPLLQALRDAGADIQQAALNLRNVYGCTALNLASKDGDKDVVQLLLQALRDAGSDIQAVVLNHRDPNGWTALMRASITCNRAIVQLLLQALRDAGADIQEAVLNHRDPDGWTVFMRASESWPIDMLKLLLQALSDAGADIQAAVNHQGTGGYTALMSASQRGHTVKVQVLLDALRDAGADIQAALNLRNVYGWTALKHVTSHGHSVSQDPERCHIEVAKLLLAYGATLVGTHIHTVARLIANASNPAIPDDKLHSIMQLQDGDITWAHQDYANFSLKFPEDRDTLDQLTSWAIILGHEAFVETVLPLLGKLSLEAHTEYLRLALQAQKFAIAERLFVAIIDQYGHDNMQTVCNYLLHLMEIERGPLPVIEFLLHRGATYKQYTQEAHCEESDRILLRRHTLFQKQKITENKSLLWDNGNVDLRLGLFESDKTLYHVACGRGNPAMLERIAQFS